MKRTQGFTLIELLVVIAVIGILSSIVLASLNTARAKGADTSIKANLSTLRSMTVIYYDTNSSYGTPVNGCTGGGMFNATTPNNISRVISEAVSASGYIGATLLCRSSGGNPATLWSVAVPLKTNPALAWCVDSSGIAKQINFASYSSSVCP